MVSVVTKSSRPFSVSGILASSFHLEDKSHPPDSPQAVSSLWGGLHALYPAPGGARIKAELSKVWRSDEADPVFVGAGGSSGRQGWERNSSDPLNSEAPGPEHSPGLLETSAGDPDQRAPGWKTRGKST